MQGFDNLMLMLMLGLDLHVKRSGMLVEKFELNPKGINGQAVALFDPPHLMAKREQNL